MRKTHYSDNQYYYTQKWNKGVCLQNILDYSPFGAALDGRTIQGDGYRYSFQGQEHDDEVKGDGNSVNYIYRMHDPRVGRFFSVDPLAQKYPELSTYQFSSNSPVINIELEGLEGVNSNPPWQNSYVSISLRLSLFQPKKSLNSDNKIDYDRKSLEKQNRVDFQPKLTFGFNRSVPLLKGINFLEQEDFLNTSYNFQAKVTIDLKEKVNVRWGIKSNLDFNTPLDEFSGEFYFGSEKNEFKFYNSRGQSVFNDQKNRVAYTIKQSLKKYSLPVPSKFSILKELSEPIEPFEKKTEPFQLKIDYTLINSQNKLYNFFSNSTTQSINKQK